MTGRVVFFDLETGGLWPSRHQVIQFAGVAIEGGQSVGELEVKIAIDPARCEPGALILNGYSVERWADAVSEAVAVKRIGDFLSKHATVERVSKKSGKPYKVARLAGHNAAAFDFAFLRKMFEAHKAFLPADYRVLDTMHLALWHLQDAESVGLQALAKRYGIDQGQAHDALADARTTVGVAAALRAEMAQVSA